MVETHSTGIGQVDRQPARRRTAAQRPAGDRADLPRRPRHLCARRRPQHQQELSDRDHLGRGRAGQRHDLHHGRRHAQRPLQQPEPADAVPRCAAGVQGRDERAAGALRPPRRFRGEHHHQVRHQQLQGQRASSSTATIASTPATRSRSSATASSATSSAACSAGRSLRNKVFFFGGYQGTIERTNPSTTISYVPTAAMLNGDFTAFASPACNAGRQVTLDRRRSSTTRSTRRAEPGGAATSRGTCRPAALTRAAASSTASRTTTPSTRTSAKVDYTLSNRQSILARYLYSVYENPATFDGQNVLTLSRTGQKNQAHSLVARPQLPAVGVAHQLAARRPTTRRSTIGRCPSTSRPPISAAASTARWPATSA